MSSNHRSRSRSPSRHSRHSRSSRPSRHKDDRGADDHHNDHRDRDEDNRKAQTQTQTLPHDAQLLSESDYFIRNIEFRKWLKDEKDRYFDELSGEKARSYFAKFVKAWNRGKLSNSYYSGANSGRQQASELTGFKWSFASKKSSADDAAIGAARRAVEAATKLGADADADDYVPRPAAASSSTSGSGNKSRAIGPTMPSRDDIVLAREAEEEHRLADRSYKRKRERVEDKERVEDLVGPKETGREGTLEKKRVKREKDKSFRDAKDDVFGEIDEGTLMGGGDSFQARIAQRDAARKRFEEKRGSGKEDKMSETREKQDAMRQKEKATMDMFRQMAKERFG